MQESRMMRRFLVLAVLAVAAGAAAQQLTPDQTLARDILKQLIEINTTDSHGTRVAAEAMAVRLRSAGFPAADVQVVGPADNPKYANLVARYRGTNTAAKPILVMAHLDVVEARREDWSVDPFTFTERDGYYY